MLHVGVNECHPTRIYHTHTTSPPMPCHLYNHTSHKHQEPPGRGPRPNRTQWAPHQGLSRGQLACNPAVKGRALPVRTSQPRDLAYSFNCSLLIVLNSRHESSSVS